MQPIPPIKERSLEDLSHILETAEDWRPDVLAEAKAEYLLRGGSLKKMDSKIKIRQNFERRQQHIMTTASYSTKEKLWIVFAGPIQAVIFRDFFPYWKGHGYTRLNKQGVFYGLLGYGFYMAVAYLYHLISQSSFFVD